MRSVFVSDAMKWFYKLVQNRRMEESTDSETRFFLYALEEAMRYIDELHRTQERLVNEHNMATRTVQEWRTALKEQHQGMARWISTKKQLPPKGKSVIVVNGHGYVTILALVEKEKSCWTWIGGDRIRHDNDITHWMPLPAREKEAQDEDA